MRYPKVLVAVGAGVGVTPFLSLLSTLMLGFIKDFF